MTTALNSSTLAKRLTAVDLVTLAVFAALYRACWYFWHALNFVFPFNQLVAVFAMIFFTMAAVVIIRKPIAPILFAIGAMTINLVIQGELLGATLVYFTWGLLPALYLYLREKAGVDPYVSLREMGVTSLILAIVWGITNLAIVYPVFFGVAFTPFSFLLMLMALGAVIGTVAGVLGSMLGNKIKGLIN
jgi:hypothetical protein